MKQNVQIVLICLTSLLAIGCLGMTAAWRYARASRAKQTASVDDVLGVTRISVSTTPPIKAVGEMSYPACGREASGWGGVQLPRSRGDTQATTSTVSDGMPESLIVTHCVGDETGHESSADDLEMFRSTASALGYQPEGSLSSVSGLTLRWSDRHTSFARSSAVASIII